MFTKGHTQYKQRNKPHYYKETFPVSWWLYDAGYSRAEIAKELNTSTGVLRKWFRHPQRYLTIEHMKRLAFMTGKGLEEVILATLRVKKWKKDFSEAWYDETGIEEGESVYIVKNDELPSVIEGIEKAAERKLFEYYRFKIEPKKPGFSTE